MTDLEYMRKKPNFIFPPDSILSWHNPIAGFVARPECAGVNVIMSDGTVSELPYNFRPASQYTPVRLNPENSIVRRVIMWGTTKDHGFSGVEMFNVTGTKVLEVGYCGFQAGMTAKEFTLEDDERLVGVRAQKHPEEKRLPAQLDLVFVIGKLDN